MDDANTILIAELGCVHVGDESRAMYLTQLACDNGADVIKLQKRNPDESVTKEMKNNAHPNAYYSYGNTYLEHRKKLELDIESHIKIRNICEGLGKKYACSVWDKTSAIEIIKIAPYFIKIPSACNMNFDLIDFVLGSYNKDVHISLGMINLDDREKIISKYEIDKRVIFYHCTSEYPCPFEHLFLNEIRYLRDRLCRQVGFSNHGYGIASDIAAMTMGATYIERHFIDDRSFRHTDASASIEPIGLRILKRDLVNVSKAFQCRKHDMTMVEEEQSKKMRYYD